MFDNHLTVNRSMLNGSLRQSSSKIRFTLTALLFVVVILYILAPTAISTSYFAILLVICFLSSLLFFTYFKRIYNEIHWLSITFLFVLSYCIVAFQVPILYVFGYEFKGIYERFIWANTDVANSSLAISSIALLAFYVGYILFVPTVKVQNYNAVSLIKYKKDDSIIFLIVMSYIFYFLFFSTSGSYQQGYYGVGDQIGYSNYFVSAFNAFLSATLILRLLYLSRIKEKDKNILTYIRYMGLPITIITFWHILFSIFVGDRGPFISYGLLYFSLYLIRWKKVRFIQVVTFIIILSTFLTIVRYARVRDGNISYMKRLENSLGGDQKNSFYLDSETPLSSTSDLALSIRNLHHAVNEVPKNHGFMWGHFQVLNLLSGVPFLAGFYNQLIFDNAFEYKGSATFLTYLQYGRKAASGEGTIPSADLYLDFGVFGVFLGFFLFGFFVRRFDFFLIIKDPPSLFIWIAALVYFSGAIYLGRGALLFYFQKVIQIYFVIMLNNLIMNLSRK